MVNHRIRIGKNLYGTVARRLRKRPTHPLTSASAFEPIRRLQEGQTFSDIRARLAFRANRPMTHLLGKRFPIGIVAISVLLFMTNACDLLRSSKPESETEEMPTAGSTYIPIPTEVSDELKNAAMPLLRIEMIKNSKNQLVPVPYFYGYPFYASDEAKIGIFRFREDVWMGYSRKESVDEDGVTYLTEVFPQVDCSFHGILETKEKYIPMFLECMLPPPNNMGGRKRPVIGNLMTGAKSRQILDEPSIKEAFLGDWHAITPGFENGDGTGYFNTEHGQLGFAFKGGKLHKLVYMFDPSVKSWRAPEIWITH